MTRSNPTVFLVDVDNPLLDNDRILAAIKKIWGNRASTVLLRQGQHAHDIKVVAGCSPADLTVERIGDPLDSDWSALPAANSLSKSPRR